MVTSGGSEDHHTTGDEQDGLRLPAVLANIADATTWVETPVRRVAGSARLNPLPHAGTISVFLLGIAVVSGLYITLFFEYGHIASYQSVASMEEHAIQRVVRALHRYSSAALIITTVIHGWRIFSAGRFVGRPRRWRWATGVAAVVLVWLTGVSGYWLVWDIRAQALNEVLIGFVGGSTAGAGFAIDHLGVTDGNSGSGFMVLMWFVHLILSAVVVYFVFRHLRRTNLPWLPPRHMMAIMGVALLLVSLAVPLGMLPAASPNRLVGEIQVDPFVLFLLPPLLSDSRWIVSIVAIVLFVLVLMLPRLLRKRDPEIITIDDQACTGCELCVIDCPYQALGMNKPDAKPQVLVDAKRCVSCGICLGSCAFGAIDLAGVEQRSPLEVAGRPLVIACDRHVTQQHDRPPDDTGSNDTRPNDPVIHTVGCAGAIAPQMIRTFVERGATDIQVIGCAPNECRYGVGNTLAEQRLTGRRAPHPAPKYARRVTQDWVPSDRFARSVSSPGQHPSADGQEPPRRREAFIGAVMIAILTATGAAFATRAPFDSNAAGADGSSEVRVVLDHSPGQTLRLAPDLGPLGSLSAIELIIDEQPVADLTAPTGSDRWAAIVDLVVPSEFGSSTPSPELSVYARSGGSTTLLKTVTIETQPDGRTLVDLTDAPPKQSVADGQRIFNSRLGGCDVCHSTTVGDDGVGPSLAGVATAAEGRVEGLTAEQYLRQSILLPEQYILDGWPAGQMLPIYRDRLNPEEIDALLSYLMTLEQPNPTTQGADS